MKEDFKRINEENVRQINKKIESSNKELREIIDVQTEDLKQITEKIENIHETLGKRVEEYNEEMCIRDRTLTVTNGLLNFFF